jgi:hypothetical protein
LTGELKRLATRLDHRCQILADASIGTTALWAGDFETAQSALESVEAEVLEARLSVHEGPIDYSVAPFIEALAHLAHALWLRGDAARAREVQRATLRAAERLDHPLSLSVVLPHAAFSSWCCGDLEECEALARRGIALAVEHGLEEAVALCTLFGGAARVSVGRTEEGLAMAHEGLKSYEATPARLASPMFAAVATACLQAGDVSEGLAVVERGLAASRETLDRMFEAELWRLKGELLLARDAAPRRDAGAGDAEADSCLERSLAISRAQGGRALELRAAASLARLWQERGELREATQILTPIVRSFDPALDTPDLRETRRILRELGGEDRRETA